MWKQLVLTEIARPLVRRLGTAAGAYLIATGVADDQATLIVNGIVALALLLVDLVNSHVERNFGGQD